MSTTPPPLEEHAPGGRPARRGKGPKPDRRFEAKTLAALLLAGLLIAFAVANSQEVEVDFLAKTTDVPLVIVILLSVLLGAVLGAAAHWRSHRPVVRAAKRR
jgi:uncharacterized integral membrane protein